MYGKRAVKDGIEITHCEKKNSFHDSSGTLTNDMILPPASSGPYYFTIGLALSDHKYPFAFWRKYIIRQCSFFIWYI